MVSPLREIKFRIKSLLSASWMRTLTKLVNGHKPGDATMRVDYVGEEVLHTVNLPYVKAAIDAMAPTGPHSGQMMLGKVVASATSGSTYVVCDLYGNGASNTATVAAANVDIHAAINRAYVADQWLTVRAYGSNTSSTVVYEAAGINLSATSTISVLTDSTWSSGGGLVPTTVTVEPYEFALDWLSGGPIGFTPGSAEASITILGIDDYTEIDLAPESRISGGHLQTRCKKVKLKITGSGYPILGIESTTNYGSWVDGEAASEWSCPTT